jgi:hypothetical protein
MTWDLSVDDFLVLVRPQLEEQIDEFIAAQPITERPAMIRQRGSLLSQLITATRIANLKYRLREAEASCARVWWNDDA